MLEAFKYLKMSRHHNCRYTTTQVLDHVIDALTVEPSLIGIHERTQNRPGIPECDRQVEMNKFR